MGKNWSLVQLKDIGRIVSGGTPSTSNSSYWSDEISWITPADLSGYEDKFILKGRKSISQKGLENSSAKLLPKGSVLFSSRAPIGYVAIASGELATNQGFKNIIPSQDVTSDFLYYYLKASKQLAEASASGTTFKEISGTKFGELPMPLPPLVEQRTIVSKIEELLSELDKGKQQLETAQQQLKIYRQAVLKWAFEGKLSEDWRDKNRNIKSSIKYLAEVSEARKNRYLSAKKNKEKRIEANYDFEYEQSEVIKSWAKGKLDKLIYIAGRIGWRGLTKDEYTTKGPMFLSVHSLNYGKSVEFKDAYHISKERYLESPEITLKDQDILLCKDGAGIGKIGIVNNLQSEATVNSSLLIIRGLEIFVPEFLYYLLSGPSLQTIVRERITGSATPHLFQNDIRKFELLIPPLEEQKQIVQEIESRLSVCDKVEETITTSLQQAETLRQSILKKAFEGKLIV